MDELSRAAADAGRLSWAGAVSAPGLEAACLHYGRAELRVAVLGPFNQGKSTLLNAVLGSRALPVALVRATAAPIVVRHGPAPESRVLLADGSRLAEPGFGLLSRCAAVGGDRALRGDVREVELLLPHPLLARGVALVDLPGTGDSPEQDAAVEQALLSTDLVVQVLNARQLLTLDERRHLDEWVFGRGIGGVLYAVNFLNLLEPHEQDAAWSRAVEVAGLEAGLPPGPRVLRVDALLALRARMRDDAAGMAASGLTGFIERLQAAIDDMERRRDAYRRPRVLRLAGQVADELGVTRNELATAANALRARRQADAAAAAARSARLSQQFSAAARNLRSALAMAPLQRAFGEAAAAALRAGTFAAWRKATVDPWLESQRAVLAALAVEGSPQVAGEALEFEVPATPRVSLPLRPSADSGSVGGSVLAGVAAGFLGGSIIPGAGHLIGAIVGGMAGFGRAEERKEEAARALRAYESQVARAYREVSGAWLARLGEGAAAAVDAYVSRVSAAFQCTPVVASAQERELDRKLKALDEVLARLHSAGAAQPACAA